MRSIHTARAIARGLTLVLVATLSLALSSCGGGGGGGGGILSSGTTLSGTISVPTSVLPISAPGVPAASLTPSAGVSSATVEVLDADGDQVATATTDDSGGYSVKLQDGTYQVGVQVGTTTYFTPLRSVIIVRDGTIDGADASSGAPTLDFELPNGTQTVSGTVTQSGSGVAGVRVQFVDAESGLVRYQVTSASDGTFSLTNLPVGSFNVRLESTSVPTGFAAPSPVSLSVTASAVSPSSLSIALQTATATSGSLASTAGVAPFASASPAGELQPAFVPEAPLEVPAGTVIVVTEIGFGEIARTTVAADGSFTLQLRDGSYLLTFEGLGADVVAPAPLRISVKDGLIYAETQDSTIDPTAGGTVDATAHAVTVTLTGTVTLSGNPVVTRVVAIDPATEGVLTSTDTASDGTYSLPLADGSYDIAIQGSLLPAGVVPPTPVRVAVESGTDPTTPVKESNGTANDGVVDFALAPASTTLTGTVSDDSSNALKDVRVVATKAGKVVARAVTAADGSYALQLPVGTIDVLVVPESVSTGLLTPDATRLEVTSSGGTTTISDASGTVTSLSIVLVARAANVTGTVKYDFNGNSSLEATEVVGCTILVRKADSKTVLLERPTDPATGGYSLVLPNGSYKVSVDPTSIPPGTAPPAAARLSVTASGVTRADGTVGTSVTVDFTLAPRVATLTGLVSLGGAGVGIGLQLVDSATGNLVRKVRSDQLTGAYRMPLSVGSYRLRLNPTTLPAGAAIPSPVPLGVASDGTVSTADGAISNPPTLNIALTRQVAILSGMVTVTRGSETFFVEAPIEVRDPQDQTVLFDLLTDPADGSYAFPLQPGSWTIAISPGAVPPGVQPPAPVSVTASGSTVTGPGVTSNTLDFTVQDTRSAGVDIVGFVIDEDADVGVPAELRVFDPSSGDAETNFLLSVLTAPDGSFAFRAVDGTYELAVLPASLPPTAVPPANVVFSVTGTSVVENNTTTSAFAFTDTTADFTANAANDGKIGCAFRDGATSGITISGTVQDASSNPVPFAHLVVFDSSTSEPVLDLFTDFDTGTYTSILPLGSYELGIDPTSLPFGMMPPAPKGVQAVASGGTTTVTTDGGAAVTPTSGAYIFDFTVVSTSQSLSGTVTDSSGSGIGVFLEVVDAVDEGFVTGRWTTPGTGAYSIQLAPGAYKVRLDPGTLPFGEGAPPPVSFTVTSSSVLEDSGTSDDGTVDLQLLSAGRTVSGTVLDSSSNPVACFVEARDIVTGIFVGGAPTSPATGSYSISLPAGSYEVRVDPPSLPPGYVPSPPQTVQLTAADGTADFSVSIASLCITGRVVTNSSELPLAVFVKLTDAATGAFIAGVPTMFSSGQFTLCVPAGNYEIEVDPYSLPAGTLAPAPETVQVTASGFVEQNTTTIGGEANSTNDGLMNFRVDDTDVSTLATFTGTVTLNPGSLPIGAFVVLENASTGAFVSGVPSDPGNGGAYTLIVPDGSYQVVVDPFSIPPGLTTPPPRNISVSGTTITQMVGSVPTVSSTYDIALEEPSNQITGTVSLSGSGFTGVIQVVDSSLDIVVFEMPTAPDGTYSIFLADGNYTVGLAPWSLPPALPVPAPVPASLSSGFVQEAQGTANDGVIDFTLSASATTLTGTVQDDAGARLFASVLVVDPSTGQIIMESFTSPTQEFSFNLIDATFDIVVDPASLPFDVVPPVPSTLTLASGTFTLDTAGSGAMADADTITITAQRSSSITALPVKIQDSGTPVDGLVEVLNSAGFVIFPLPVPATSGGGSLLLTDGTYTLHVVPWSIPPIYAAPADQTLVVSGSGTTFTVDGSSASQVLFSLTQGTLQGTIVNAWLGGSQRVELDLLDGDGTTLYSNITLTQSTNDARYGDSGDVVIADGTYKLHLRRATGETASTVIIPGDKWVNVLNGVIQNPDDIPSTAGVVDVNMTIPITAGTVAGTVTVGGSPVGSVDMVVKDPVDDSVVNLGTADGSGAFVLAVPSGFFRVRPDPASLASASGGTANPATPYDVTVTTAGEITVDGGGACAGTTGPSEACTDLDFALTAFDPSADALVTGTITARQTATSTPTAVANVNVFLVDVNGVPFASTLTASDGTYSLISPSGIWFVYADAFGVDAGYPILPPDPSQITVTGTTVSPSSTVDFSFEGATALLTGQVQTASAAGVGARLVVTSASATEIPDGFVHDAFTGPDGNFFLPVGQGNFKLWVDPGSIPPGFLPPSPIVFGVSSAAVTESDTFGVGNSVDDGIINPVVIAGGATARAVVYESAADNPVPCFVGLLQTAANPSDPPFFMFGQPTDPTTAAVSFTTGSGSYFLEIDPMSLPGTLQPPGRIDFSVSGSTVTYETGTETTTIGGDTYAVFRVGSAAATLSGLVRTDLADPSTGIPAVIVVVDATTSAFVRDAFASPADGSYSMGLGDGAYDVFVDPMSLPPGEMGPAPVRVTVNGSSITESSGTADDGIVNFAITTAGVTLSGEVVTPTGAGAFANVGLFAADTSGEYSVFMTGTPADFSTGRFDIPVASGTYQLMVDPGSIPPGFMPPAPVVISVAGSTIDYGSGTTTVSGGTTLLQLALQTAAGSVAGSVTDSSGNGVPVFVIAEEASSGAWVGGSPTDANGNYSISLAAGTYSIFIDPSTLPLGVVPPAPIQVTVTDSAVTGVDFAIASAGASFQGYVLSAGGGVDTTTIDCSAITSTAGLTPVITSVLLMQPSPDPTVPPTFLAEVGTRPTDGFFSLPLGEGTYEVHVDGATLPPGVLPPPPLTVVNTGGTVTVSGQYESCTDVSAQKILLVGGASATINGIVQDSSGTGYGAFVELTDASTGAFVTGTPTDSATGAFQMPLGSLSYELRVDPFTLPPGFSSPPPVAISVVGGSVSVGSVSGVSWDSGTSTLTITLSSASTSVSGTVVDSSGAGRSVRVLALDFNDQVISSVFSSGADGSYSMPLAPDIYTMRIDPFTLPSGLMSSGAQTVDLISSTSATANFTLVSAPATISGALTTVSGGSTIGVPGFVKITDTVTGALISGTPAAPDGSGGMTYSLAVGAGTFDIQVDPTSVPIGTVVPPPVGFSVTISSVSGAVTISEDDQGDGSSTSDGVIDFLLSSASATLSGRLVNPSSSPVTGTVILELNDGSGTEVASASAGPDGTFSLALGGGNFLLFVDPASLPPLHIPPPPMTVTVTGSTVLIDGSAPTGPPHDITVGIADTSLSGHVYLADGTTPVQGAFVAVVESASGAFLGGMPTAADGVFSLPLTAGSFLVQVDPMSLPTGLTPPAPTAIYVASGTVYQGTDSSGTDITSAGLDLLVTSPAASVTVHAEDGVGQPMAVQVNVRDAGTQALVTTAFTDSTGDTTIGLPAGSYLVRVPDFSVPPGSVPPAPASLTVNGDGTTSDSSGLPADGLITIVFGSAAASISGTVTLASDGSAVPGVHVVAEELGTGFSVADQYTAPDGTYQLGLPVGEYELVITEGLPSGVVAPAPQPVIVGGDGSVTPGTTIDITLAGSVGTLSGQVTLDGAGIAADLTIFQQSGPGWTPVASVLTDATGNYSVGVPQGPLVALAELDEAALPDPTALILAPLPVSQAFPSPGPSAVTQNFAFTTTTAGGAPASEILRGTVTAAGAPYPANIQLAYSGMPMALIPATGGSYRFPLLADSARSFTVAVDGEGLPSSFTPPAAVTVSVDPAATPPVSGTGVSASAGEYVLDFTLGVSGIALTGTITDWAGVALAGIEVRTVDLASDSQGPTVFTDSTGAYSLILAAGDYELELASGLPPAAVRPAVVDLVAVDESGTLNLYVDGVDTSTHDVQLQAGVARLSGQILVGGAPASGEVIAYSGTTEISFNFATGGTYEIYLPAGAVTVVAEPVGLTSSMLLATPYSTTITDTGSLQELTHDFTFADVSAGGGATVNGAVLSDGSGLDAEVVIASSTGSPFGSVLTNPADGVFGVSLPDGSYTLSVFAGDIPAGAVGTSSADITVASGAVTGPALIGGQLIFNLDTTGTAVSGQVTFGGSAVEGAVLQILPVAGSGGVFATTDASGNYAVKLSSGDYELEFVASTLPSGSVLPSIVDLTVSSSPMTQDFALQAAAGTASGTVTVAGSPTAGASVFAYDSTLTEITFADTDSSGNYTIALPAGDFTLVAELDAISLAEVITPAPRAVTITSGAALTGEDFAFLAVGSAAVLTVKVEQGGSTLPFSGRVETSSGGTTSLLSFIDSTLSGGVHQAQIALADGSYNVTIDSVSGAAASLTDEVIAVTAPTITGDAGPLAGGVLTFTIAGEPGGAITLSDGSPFASGTVALVPTTGGAATTTTTNSSGQYAFSGVSAGEYWLVLQGALPVGDAVPRARRVTVGASSVYPSNVDLQVTTKVGILSGTVSVDGAGQPARVYVLDRGASVVAVVDSDSAGAYSVPLAAGSYLVLASLASASGNEVPPVPVAVNLAGDATADVSYSTATASQALSGSVTIGGVASRALVLITQVGPPPVPVAIATPAVDGSYAVPLPFGNYTVALLPDTSPAGVVSFAPVTITVDTLGIAGTDPEGAAISGGVLDLEPHGASDAGQVRLAASTLFTAFMNRDGTAISAGLDAATLWDGEDAAGVLASYTTGAASDTPDRFDGMVGVITGTGDAVTLTISQGRECYTDSSGNLRAFTWNSAFSGEPAHTLAVARTGPGAPWLIAGNGLHVAEVDIAPYVNTVNVGGVETTSNGVDFTILENPSHLLTSASVSGTGITDGTLAEQLLGGETEWYGYLTSSPGDPAGPSPFAGTFASLVDGGTYTFSAVAPTGTDAPALIYNAPTAGVTPTVSATTDPSGNVVLTWPDLSSLLDRPYQETYVELSADAGGGSFSFVTNVEDLPAGTASLTLPAASFSTGTTYSVLVEVVDVGLASVEYELEFVYPPSPAP